MIRTSNSFSVLRATAAIAGLAVLLWSLGLSSFHFVNAANVTTISDTLSDSAPAVVSNHTITFTTPTGVAAGEDIVITFPAGFTGIGSLVAADLDLLNGATDEDLIDGAASAANWNVTAAGQVITITSGTDTIPGATTVTIEIGTNATFPGAGTNQITNPATGSYQVEITVGSGNDTGAMNLAIVDNVTVNASVDTLFTFTVTGVASAQTVNGTTTGGATTATNIPFGALDANTASTAAQDLSVTTNAANGFVVTVTANGQLNSTTGADIDGFRNGNFDTTSVQWESPASTLGSEETYGHWGITSDDATLTAGAATDLYDVGGDGQNYVSASTTAVEVFRHDAVADGTVQGEGFARVGYTVEIGSLQEGAEDYTAILTYIATPVF